jgi:outer membrane protein assembly factor BamD
LLKSNDYDLKYEKAMEYYDAEDYIRASTLLEELMAVYRGTETAEQVYYRYAYTYYYQKDYFTAGYYFDHFVSNFPNSKYADECAFMKAYCFYMDSPSPNLDQTSTYKAIDELQIFINRHPQSTRIEECNRLIDELNDKLVEKSFNGAKLYFDLGEFKASITALNNSLLEYPDTKYREELLYLILKSNFELARNSIQEKIRERYEQTTEAYYKLVEEFPETKHLREAERIYQAAQKAL